MNALSGRHRNRWFIAILIAAAAIIAAFDALAQTV